MIKPLQVFFISGTLLFSACVDNSGGAKKETFEVSSTNVQFGATLNSTRVITVDAVNVAWDYKVAQDAEGWLSAEREGDRLIVEVTDNDTRYDRTGYITVTPGDVDEPMKDISISVTQKANPKAEFLNWSLDSDNLTFYSHTSPAQSVLAHYESDGILECNATVENPSVNSWIRAVVEDNKITVSVADNSETEQRIGSIVVTPLDKRMKAKKIWVTQLKHMQRPTLDITKRTELIFKATDSLAYSYKSIMVHFTNSTCSYGFVNNKGESVDCPLWLQVGINAPLGELDNMTQDIFFRVSPNGSPEPRGAYMEIDTSGFPPSPDDPNIILMILQEGA